MENGTFDSIFSSGKIQMLKVLLPFLPEDKRGAFAVFIRLQELLYTIRFIQGSGNVIPMEPPKSGEALLDAMLPYCAPEQAKQLQNLKETLRQAEQMKEMMETVQAMKELFPGDSPESSGAGFDFAQVAELMAAMQPHDAASPDVAKPSEKENPSKTENPSEMAPHFPPILFYNDPDKQEDSHGTMDE